MSRKFYILRHGQAEDHRDEEYDFHRDLVERGINQIKTVSRFINSKKFNIDCIYSSELNRAVQTASIVAKEIGDVKLKKAPWLNIYSNIEVAKKNMLSLSKESTPLFVGHNPDLTSVVCKILGCERDLVRIKKSALLCLSEDSSQNLRLDFSIPVHLM